MSIHVDFFEFITTGELGPLRIGTDWSLVVSALGEPPLHEPPRDGAPAFARYGDLDFTIEGGRVSVISLHVHRPSIALPEALELSNFEDAELSIAEVENRLANAGVTWARFEPMCDDWIDYFMTSAGVHLSFGGRRLGAVACDGSGLAAAMTGAFLTERERR